MHEHLAHVLESVASLRGALADIRVEQALAQSELQQNRRRVSDQFADLSARLAEVESAVNSARAHATQPGILGRVAGLVGAVLRALLIL